MYKNNNMNTNIKPGDLAVHIKTEVLSLYELNEVGSFFDDLANLSKKRENSKILNSILEYLEYVSSYKNITVRRRMLQPIVNAAVHFEFPNILHKICVNFLARDALLWTTYSDPLVHLSYMLSKFTGDCSVSTRPTEVLDILSHSQVTVNLELKDIVF